tara:strand:- start:243 stop:386 length:144 start_codon:yes stop_codon:yes gene_type:complete
MWEPAVQGYFETRAAETGIPIKQLNMVIVEIISLGRDQTMQSVPWQP